MPSAYSLLRKRIESSNLMRTRKVRYLLTSIFIASALGVLIVLPAVVGGIWMLLSAAVVAGFFSVQAGFVGHDAGHMSITRNRTVASIFGQFGMSLVNGMSYNYWISRHNTHHSNPNDDGIDPDVVHVPFSFSDEIARKKKGFSGFITRYQEYTLFPVSLFNIISLRVRSWITISKDGKSLFDFIFIGLHFVAFLILPMVLVGWWQGLVFYLIYSLVSGLYFGLVFLPNHLGMDTTSGKNLNFMEQQLISSRNVKTPKWFDFFFGGLNYQIEHHLFPTMPRWNLRKARSLVKSFCEENKLFYHEESVIGTYASLVRFSRKMGKRLRS